jgi:hypothetical protein
MRLTTTMKAGAIAAPLVGRGNRRSFPFAFLCSVFHVSSLFAYSVPADIRNSRALAEKVEPYCKWDHCIAARTRYVSTRLPRPAYVNSIHRIAVVQVPTSATR